MLDAISERMGVLLEHGNMCRHPVSDPIEDGLFELRPRHKKVRMRLIYYFGQEAKIIFVHAVFKDQRKLDRADIDLAKRNRRYIQEGMVQINVSNIPR